MTTGGRAAPALLAAAVVLLAVGIAVASRGAATWRLELGDSDNFMRLAQVRDWLGGQSWWDVHQYRADPPAGVAMHWSRLADLPLAGTLLVAQLFAAPALAERIALCVQPLLLLIVALALIARCAVALGGRAAAVAALLIAAVTPYMLVQFVPGRVDHHGLQIVLVLVIATALATGTRARNGAAAALAAALSLNIGLETAPLLGAAGAFVALRWVARGEAARAVTLGFAAGVAALVPLVFALTVPRASWALVHGDAIAGGHVAAALAGGAGLAALALWSPGRPWRAAGVAALAVAIALLVRLGFPGLLTAPYAAVGPMLQRLWMDRINEMTSVVTDWRASPARAIARMTLLVPAALAGVVLAVRRTGEARDGAALLAVLAVTATALAAWQVRAIPLATAVVMPIAGAVIGSLWQRYRAGGSVAPLLGGLLLLSTVPGAVLVALTAPAPAAPAPGPPWIDCGTPTVLRTLARQPAGLVAAPLDLGGPIIVLTHHNVVGTPIHRDVHGNRLVYTALRANSADARAMLLADNVGYLAWCPGSDAVILSNDAPGGLLAALRRGRVPAWLTPIAAPGDALRLYRLTPVAAPPAGE